MGGCLTLMMCCNHGKVARLGFMFLYALDSVGCVRVKGCEEVGDLRVELTMFHSD